MGQEPGRDKDVSASERDGWIRALTQTNKKHKVRWVVNADGELGVLVENDPRPYYCYKGESIQYQSDEERVEPLIYRPVGKREFGETIQGHNHKETKYTFDGWVHQETNNPVHIIHQRD